jgi:hypothetical protein
VLLLPDLALIAEGIHRGGTKLALASEVEETDARERNLLPSSASRCQLVGFCGGPRHPIRRPCKIGHFPL